MKDFGFKFKIGETVTPNLVWKFKREGTHRGCVGEVVARHLESCPGGIQRHYDLRLLHDQYIGSLSVPLVRFNEVELRKWVKPPATKAPAKKKLTKKTKLRAR